MNRFAVPRRLVVACLAGLLLPALACSSQASPTSMPSASPTPTSSPTTAPTPTPSPTPVPIDTALLNRRLTVLILGTDSNIDRARRNQPVHTDTILLASVSADHRTISMVSLPRDTVNMPLANGQAWYPKVNELAIKLGIPALRAALERDFGIRIDYHIEIDMNDFGALVDAIHGVDVNNPYALVDPSEPLNLSAGWHHLGGNDALRYVRSRDADSDYARSRRQQQVLQAMVAKLIDPKTQLDLPKVLAALHSLRTDLPLAKLATFAEIARRSQGARFVGQVLEPPTFALFAGIENGPRGWIMIPNLAAMRAYVHSVMPPP